MREFIIISFQQHVSISFLTGIFPHAHQTHKERTKDAGIDAFSVEYKNEGPSMTGGTVLIGGPFVFPCGSTWHAQRVSGSTTNPFLWPPNFSKEQP